MLVAGPLVELDAFMELTPKLDDVPIVEVGDEKREVLEVEDGMEVVPKLNRILLVLTPLPLFGSGTTSIPSSTSGTSPFSSPASTISTSSSFGVSSINASNSTSGPATSIFWSTWDPKRAYRSDSMVAKDTHVHGTDMSVDSMVAEDTHVHETGATLNNYDHTHMDMVVEDCIQTLTGETYVASPLFRFDSGTQPPFSSYALHLDWWPAWISLSLDFKNIS
nr:hypothetical protein [Tanacetum cinerariifolium]